MKTNLHIRNFGKIKSANIQLRPFTTIVGPNSSGKSLITKSLYSILHSMSQNSMGNPNLDSVSILQFQLNLIVASILFIVSVILIAMSPEEKYIKELE